MAHDAGPIVTMPDHFDISPPLRDINVPPVVEADKHERPLHMPRSPRSPSSGPDPVVQSAPGALVNATGGISFDGVGANGYAPPDTNMAVGPNHIVQWVNVRFAIYHKDGTILAGFPKDGNAIWSGFGGDCEFKNGGDPIAQYDAAHDRWLMTQLGRTSNPYSQCIAVSTSGDPTGTYARYQYNYGSTLNDYPKFGIWPDAYYASYNLFYGSSGGQACAYDSIAMRSGLPAAQSICFTKSNDFSFLPSDLDGSTPPPAGSPNYFLTTWSSTSLNLYKFHVDFATPANSTFTGPTSITVASYSEACGGGACIPQLGTSQQLDSLADRPMYRLAYRKFSDHEALVMNHSVAAGSAVGVRWYEIRDPNGTPTVYQQGTFAPDDGNYRWMGSAAMDQAGDIAIGYSVSSGSMHPSIAYTGRVPTDPLGTMGAEAAIINGTGSQTGGLSRWGDYSALRIDPSDDCTFWYTNEYLKADGSFNWSTRIASFKFSGCGGTPPPPPAAPDGLATTLVAYNEVDLQWNDNSTNENGFQILRCTGASCTPTMAIGSVGANVTSYKDTTVAASTTYVYKVQAYNGGGTVDCVNPATVSATTSALPPPSSPAAPTNLRVTAATKNWISLSWQDNSNNETNFDIERCTGATCTNFAPLTSVGANVTTYQNTRLARHTTYRYQIKARNSGGSSAYAGPVSGTTN